jgi:hypothetical protein
VQAIFHPDISFFVLPSSEENFFAKKKAILIFSVVWLLVNNQQLNQVNKTLSYVPFRAIKSPIPCRVVCVFVFLLCFHQNGDE